MMMVVAVLAVATIMGFVMLSSATLQNRAGANQSKLVDAEYLAESGINIAMYYIQYPDRAPSLNADGYWPGTGGELDMGDGAKLTIGVTRDPVDDCGFEVTTSVSIGEAQDTRISRNAGARLYLRKRFDVTRAAAFNTDTQISAGTTIGGDVYTSKNLALKTGVPLPVINGRGYCKTASVGSLFTAPLGGFRTASPPLPGAPTLAAIDLYQDYKYGQQRYNCSTISSGTLSNETTLGPTEINPAGVYYADHTLQIDSNVTINGTLVVLGGVNVRGSNIVINPKPGFPALIVTGILDIDRTLKGLTVNGTCYVGQQIRGSGTTPISTNLSTFTVNGGLLVGLETGAPFPTTGYNIKTSVIFDAAKVSPLALKVPSGVSVLRWGLP